MSLLTDSISNHLTAAPIDNLARRTNSGQAHFAGTGPSGSTCRQCAFWGASFNPTRRFEYYSKSGGKGGGLKPHACEKYRQMMNGKIGGKVPDDAAACKHFDLHSNPPIRFAK